MTISPHHQEQFYHALLSKVMTLHARNNPQLYINNITIRNSKCTRLVEKKSDLTFGPPGYSPEGSKGVVMSQCGILSGTHL